MKAISALPELNQSRSLVLDTAARFSGPIQSFCRQFKIARQETFELSPEFLVHPNCFSAIYRIKEVIGQLPTQKIDSEFCNQISNDLTQVLASRAQLMTNCQIRKLPLDFSATDLSAKQSLSRSQKMVDKLDGVPKLESLAIVGEPAEHLIQKVLSAYTAIKALWPELHDEIANLIQRFIFFRGMGTIGHADIKFNGAIFIRESRFNGPTYIEDIVHEAGHVTFNFLMVNHRIYNNSHTQQVQTPLRRDLRPIWGLLHQTFVLFRIRELYRRLCANPNMIAFLKGDAKQFQDRLFSVSDQFDIAYASVLEHVNLTAVGHQLIESMGTLSLGAQSA